MFPTSLMSIVEVDLLNPKSRHSEQKLLQFYTTLQDFWNALAEKVFKSL